tara:strand:- start:135 stop:413 length:279 start_codon:yes stop_codon:yes gene_type:complete
MKSTHHPTNKKANECEEIKIILKPLYWAIRLKKFGTTGFEPATLTTLLWPDSQYFTAIYLSIFNNILYNAITLKELYPLFINFPIKKLQLKE